MIFLTNEELDTCLKQLRETQDVEFRKALEAIMLQAKAANRYRAALEKVRVLRNRFEEEATYLNARALVSEMQGLAAKLLTEIESK